DTQVTTLKIRATAEEIGDPNTPKVVCDPRGRALYFSRHAIPYDRDRRGDTPYWKHLGLYAYTGAALHVFHSLPPSALERAEGLEADHGDREHAHHAAAHAIVGRVLEQCLRRRRKGCGAGADGHEQGHGRDVVPRSREGDQGDDEDARAAEQQAAPAADVRELGQHEAAQHR